MSLPKTVFKKDSIPWNKGTKGIMKGFFKVKHLSEETKKKLSLSHLGKPSGRKGIKGVFHHTDETKRKIGLASKKQVRSLESRKKLSESLKGEKSHLWRGGISPINRRIRRSLEFRLWRESVFQRDNWTCKMCKVRGGKLHPHHILNFSDHFGLRFAIDNGITLCENCHKGFHKKYGLFNNTKCQLDEYLIKQIYAV